MLYQVINSPRCSAICQLRKESLQNDPLRMLRAFRLASQLNFTVENEITDFITGQSSLINEVAKERIRDELFLLLQNPLSYGYLKNPAAKILLKQILGKNLNLENLKRLEDILLNEKTINKDLQKKIALHLVQEEKGSKTRRDLLKFSTLTFSPSQKEYPLSSIGKELKLRRKDIEIMKKIEKLYPHLEGMMENKEKTLDTSQFLIQAGRETVEISLLYLITYFRQQTSSRLLLQLLEEYFRKSDLILHPPALIKGKEIMELLNIPAGPSISSLLDKIHRAQVRQEIKTKEEAKEYVKKLVAKRQ